MDVQRGVEGLRGARAGLEGSVGFVPTMGALHEGHFHLMRRARDECDRLVVSIFVNPKQFGPGEDLEAYPRDEAADLAACESLGADLVFLPPVEEMYPEDFATRIEVGGPALGLEGAHRPGHFDGVATVCARLFGLVRPDRAYFGWKDMQQFCVLRRLVADLALPLVLVPCEIVREPDGLALSSRNRYLSPADRKRAPGLHAALQAARRAFLAGERRGAVLLETARRALPETFEPAYFALRREADFTEPKDPVGEGVRILAAARLGRTRLLDNLPLVPAEDRGGFPPGEDGKGPR